MTGITPQVPKRPLFWSQQVLDLCDLLNDINLPVYIVGGAVRDALLSRPIKDIDLITPVDSLKLARWIADRMNGAIFVLDDERGVARVLVDTPDGRLTLDVARFRGEDLAADLRDRDFTINAMAVDLKGDIGQLIDPCGGQQDALDKIIRRCTPHALAHDPIRALRAVRQSVQLAMRLHPDTLADIRTYAVRLSDTSPERQRDELLNLLNISRPAAALRVARALGLLTPLIPETDPYDDLVWRRALTGVEYLSNLFTAISPARGDHTAAAFHLGMIVIQLDRFRKQLQAHTMAMWANERPHRSLLLLTLVLCPAQLTAKTLAARFDALRLSNAEKTRLTAAYTALSQITALPLDDPRALYRFWLRYEEAGIDGCLLGAADFLAVHLDDGSSQDAWLRYVERIVIVLDMYYQRCERSVAPPPLVDGKLLIDTLNLAPGPHIGQLLALIREEQILGTLHTVEDALALARAHQ